MKECDYIDVAFFYFDGFKADVMHSTICPSAKELCPSYKLLSPKGRLLIV